MSTRVWLTLVVIVAGAVAAQSSPATSATRIAPCRSANLRLILGSDGAAAGTSWTSLIFINFGPACSLRGYPGVSTLDDLGHEVGAPAARELGSLPGAARRVATIVILRYGTASSVLRQGTTANIPRATCHPQKVSQLRVYAPGETHALSVGYPETECSKGPSVAVTPITAGPGPLLTTPG